jgi:DNA ligase-1
MPATKTLRREFLQLADTYDPAKHNIAGFYISEKLDGTRCFWDGGISRGEPTASVPWANVVDPKTGEKKGKIKGRSTGLWSRYGNPIMAPDSFLNALPSCPLDGELWAGRGKFQLCRSICAGDEPDPRFNQISYAVYSSPSLMHVFRTGLIKNTNMVLDVQFEDFEKYVLMRLDKFGGDYRELVGGKATFEEELLFLREAIESQSDQCFLHKQVKLPGDEDAAKTFANEYLDKMLDLGAEGCVIRDGSAIWTPKRHKGLLKFKPYEDAEAKVIGYVCGKEGKQGNVLGKIGALKVRSISLKKNVEFEIGSGLTFADREFATAEMTALAAKNPGEACGPGTNGAHMQGKVIRIGDTITFKYRELSDDGIPKEGRYWRRRDGVE